MRGVDCVQGIGRVLSAKDMPGLRLFPRSFLATFVENKEWRRDGRSKFVRKNTGLQKGH